MKKHGSSSGAGVIVLAALVSVAATAHAAGRSNGASPRGPIAAAAPGDGRPGIALDRSENGGEAITVQFVNRRPWPVRIHWVDFTGVEKPYGVIPAGGSLPMKTFVRHLWVFRRADSGAEVWRWYAPSARAGGTVEIN